MSSLLLERITNILAPLTVQRTRLSEAVLAWLRLEERAVITPYALFFALRQLYTGENRRKLYLRSDTPTKDDLRRVTANLSKTGAIELDPDYGRSVYKVPLVGESSADEVCALANPFGHISHLSAMQRWGLTDRRPEALHLTMPPAKAARPLVEEQMHADYGMPFLRVPSNQAMKLHFLRHPKIVRGRNVSVHETLHPSRWLEVRGSHARLATIGQTFLDTVERPQYCGGMGHVLDVWRNHAAIYLEEITSIVDEIATPIAKVRAGYLLDDMLGFGNDSTIQGWVKFAQRGGSRVLDPDRGFSTQYSEKWMLSINA